MRYSKHVYTHFVFGVVIIIVGKTDSYSSHHQGDAPCAECDHQAAPPSKVARIPQLTREGKRLINRMSKTIS